MGRINKGEEEGCVSWWRIGSRTRARRGEEGAEEGGRTSRQRVGCVEPGYISSFLGYEVKRGGGRKGKRLGRECLQSGRGPKLGRSRIVVGVMGRGGREKLINTGGQLWSWNLKW